MIIIIDGLVGFLVWSRNSYLILDNKMPSFDVVSDFNRHEVANAVDQSNREVTTRFDFKGSNSKFILEENSINLISQS